MTITELDEAVNGVKVIIRKYGRLFGVGGDGAGKSAIEEMLSLTVRFDPKMTASVKSEGGANSEQPAITSA